MTLIVWAPDSWKNTKEGLICWYEIVFSCDNSSIIFSFSSSSLDIYNDLFSFSFIISFFTMDSKAPSEKCSVFLMKEFIKNCLRPDILSSDKVSTVK